MSLQFVFGVSGSGKSHKIYTEMIEKSLKEPQGSFIAIVPEQFTMQVQKDMVDMHPDKGMLGIDVVSFARLAYKVFEEIGVQTLQVLDETGKSLVLRKVIEDHKKELTVFKNKIKMPGFIEEMKSMLSEFFQYGIDEKSMDQILAVTDSRPLLQAKLKDIRQLYQAFKLYLSDKYIISEDILDLLCSYIEQSNIIRNSELYIDSFNGFTPVQYKVIGLLMQYAKKVTVTVTFPIQCFPLESVRRHHLFYPGRVTIERLLGLAGECGIEVCPDIAIEAEVPYRLKNTPSLSHLEKNIFRYQKGEPFEGEQSVSIHMVNTPYEEAEFAARQIFSLVYRQGYHYRDIAIVTGDIENYHRELKEVFTLNGIPYFIDYKRGLRANPLIESLRAVMEIIEKRFSYESIFRYLRSGMAGIGEEEVDLLENYVISRGIKGVTAWKRDWDKEEMQIIKDAFIAPVLILYETLKKKDYSVEEKTLALYRFITGQNMAQRLEEFRETLVLYEELDLAKEYAQVYKLVMELFDKVVSLLGEEKLSFEEYRSILEAGFEEIKVGIIPPTIDQVVVGDIERTRLNHVKTLIFLGVNDGIIPKSGNAKGLLSEREREFLSSAHIELSPTARENSFIQRFYLYLALTKPSERLILSFSKVSSEGTSLRPSYLVNTILNMFPGLCVIDEEKETSVCEQVISEYAGMKYLAGELRSYSKKDMEPAAKDLFSLYSGKKELQDKLKTLIDAAFYRLQEGVLNEAVTKALYGERGGSSVSRLEKFAGCAYSHFLSYGMALAQRKEYSVEAVDLGVLYHDSLELFSKRLENSSFNFRTIPEEFRESLVQECVEEVTKDYGNMILLSSARNAYIIKRLKRITSRTVWALSEHIKRGKFDPRYYELSIRNGRIDRVDVFDNGKDLYVKIIDYKSGNKVFDIADTYYNLQIQLVLYMDAVLEKEKRENPDKNIIPAAICYYQVKDPVINKGENLLEQFQMNGLINSSEEVIEAMDSGLEGKSVVVPVSKKNGKISSHPNLVGEEDFTILIEHVKNSVNELNEQIDQGNIEINPYEKKNYTSCDYCPYMAVCGFDPRLPFCKYRKLDGMKPEEVWNKIKGKEEE